MTAALTPLTLLTLLLVTVALIFGVAGMAQPKRGRQPRRDASPAPPVSVSPDNPAIAIADAIFEPIMIVTDSWVSHANPAARALLGDHIVGEDIRVAIRHPAAADRLSARDAVAGGDPISLVGIGARDQRWQMRVAPLGSGQRLIHLIDETGNYAAQRMRVDFVANASHELRTPLSAILGFVETLSDDKAGGDSATRARFLNVILAEAQRMQRLVDDLMSLSRIEADKYRAPEDRIDFGDLLGEVMREIQASGGDRAREIMVEVEGAPMVIGDHPQLSQLLHNLIGNAMKYGRSGSPIRITAAEAAGNMLRLTIADEGEGVPAVHLPRLTERFYRVDPGRSRAVGGTGLGLAIVKHIVERHRGRLEITSTPGVGTTVTIRLPLARVINP